MGGSGVTARGRPHRRPAGISGVHPLIEHKACQSAQGASIAQATTERSVGEHRPDARVRHVCSWN